MSKPLIKLENAIFKGLATSKSTPPVFKNPISLTINPQERWAIIGTFKTQFMKALASQFISDPPLSRTYPFLNKTVWPQSVIQFLEFKGALPTAHLAARYEFFKDEFDETTRKFVIGNLTNTRAVNEELLASIFKKLKLEGLEDRWSMGLSNGQMRRARLAKALIHEPKLLIIDDPFLGLDPTASSIVSDLLGELPPNPHVVLGLRYQDTIPDWITNIAVVDENGVITTGKKTDVQEHLDELKAKDQAMKEEQSALNNEKIENLKKLFNYNKNINYNIPLLEFKNISVAYRGQQILTNLSWTVPHGSKWHVQGNNGTGKSTLLSLITADHPQAWNSSVVMYGEPRRTGKQNFFDINKEIGFTSPELHVIFPGNLSVYDAVATGFVVGSFIPPKDLSKDQMDRIMAYLKEFNIEHKKDVKFHDLSISDQKLVLFIRSIIKNPDLLILDEAFSVMDDTRIEQCKELLRHYPGAVLAIGHLESEVPDTDRYIKLLGPGKYETGFK